ncbi:MAG: hypothetical protein HKM26_00180, partial [Winogradskyella sp.]|nr:hypothetical protein [Winogradskyella sp.]
MKVTLHPPRFALIALILLFITFTTAAQEIASFSSVQNNGCSGTINSNVNITTTGICRGTGITSVGGPYYTSNGWAWDLDATNYLEWSITPNAGYQINLTSITLNYFKGNNGPGRAELQIDYGLGFTTINDDPVNTNTDDVNTVDISTLTEINTPITFRLFAYRAAQSTGEFTIKEIPSEANKGVIINGNVELIPCPTITTWDGTSWDNGTPTLA